MSVLLPAQRAFVLSRAPFPAFVGGFGSGKTAAGIARAMALKAHFPQQDVAYYLPTYPLVEDIAFRRFPELCERKGWDFKMRGGSNPHIEFPGAGRIIFRSMEHPHRIVGWEVAHSVVDELDTMPHDKAREAWSKIIARNRSKIDGWPNTVGVVTTPEGFRFVHERWVKNSAPGYEIHRANTMDNAANLPDGYIENLRNTYSSAQLSAYLDGQFVNLTAGTVYTEFDRTRHASRERIEGSEPLHIGMDFNVTKMAAVVHVMRDGQPHAVQEYTGVYDTPSMIALIKARHEGHQILVYPDASGGARKSANASQSDISLLHAAGFRVCANSKNPAVKDRIAAMQKLFREDTYRINPDTCPELVEACEQQAYDKNGEPDKSSGHDHVIDAAGYFGAYKFPVSKPAHIEALNL